MAWQGKALSRALLVVGHHQVPLNVGHHQVALNCPMYLSERVMHKKKPKMGVYDGFWSLFSILNTATEVWVLLIAPTVSRRGIVDNQWQWGNAV